MSDDPRELLKSNLTFAYRSHHLARSVTSWACVVCCSPANCTPMTDTFLRNSPWQANSSTLAPLARADYQSCPTSPSYGGQLRCAYPTWWRDNDVGCAEVVFCLCSNVRLHLLFNVAKDCPRFTTASLFVLKLTRSIGQSETMTKVFSFDQRTNGWYSKFPRDQSDLCSTASSLSLCFKRLKSLANRQSYKLKPIVRLLVCSPLAHWFSNPRSEQPSSIHLLFFSGNDGEWYTRSKVLWQWG